MQLMRRKPFAVDRLSGFVVLLLAVAILWQGKDLPRGGLHSPGPGFFPTLLSIVLILLSLFLIIFHKDRGQRKPSLPPRSAARVILVIVFLAGYFLLLQVLGFAITSFLLMSSLFWTIAGKKWHVALLWAFLSTGSAYLLFAVLLKSDLPSGIFGF